MDFVNMVTSSFPMSSLKGIFQEAVPAAAVASSSSVTTTGKCTSDPNVERANSVTANTSSSSAPSGIVTPKVEVEPVPSSVKPDGGMNLSVSGAMYEKLVPLLRAEVLSHMTKKERTAILLREKKRRKKQRERMRKAGMGKQQVPRPHLGLPKSSTSSSSVPAPSHNLNKQGCQKQPKRPPQNGKKQGCQKQPKNLKKNKKAQGEEEDHCVAKDAEESQIWNDYECHSLTFGKKHPGDVVEPASLAAVRLPLGTFPVLDTLKRQCEDGSLSALQLEGIAAACSMHRKIRPNGERMGFYIGDAAGMGKGRSISGIILDNYSRGEPKHIWFSASTDLAKDSSRDLCDIGFTIPVIDGCVALDRADKRMDEESKELSHRGLLFCTYSTLVSSSGKKDRYKQITSWLGDPKTFSGCIVFDEAHKAKNFNFENEKKSSKVAKAVLRLQEEFPKARVVYASATGLTNIYNMAYMNRLGLWGKGTPFRNFASFCGAMGKKNLGALEMLSMELKSNGMYVSRSLSYRDTSFETIQASLSSEQCEMYRIAAKFWLDMRVRFEEAEEICTKFHVGEKKRRGFGSAYWGAHQRFFKQLIIAFKVPSIVKMVREILEGEEKKCIVLGVQCTGECALDFYDPDSEKMCLVSPCKISNLCILKFIEANFPKTDNISATSEAWETLESIKRELIVEASKLTLPASALDDLIFQLGGHGRVAEMTGRAKRIGVMESLTVSEERKTLLDVADMCEVVSRKDSTLDSNEALSAMDTDSLNIMEKEAFMNGDKLIAIISDAASTGISLHADRRVKNQHRRVHITCELAWAADASVQQLGRTHRSHQSSGPEYKLLSSGIGGENRFVTAVASRLQSLGALTRGDRRATSSLGNGDFNYNTKYGRDALKELYDSAICSRLARGVEWEKVVAECKVQLNLAKVSAGKEGFWDSSKEIASKDDFVKCVRQCIFYMLGNYSLEQIASFHHLPPFPIKDRNEKTNITKFLNRLLALPIPLQGLLFTYFALIMERVVKEAKLSGMFDEGASDLSARSATLESKEVLYEHPATGGQLTLHRLLIDRGISFEAAVEMLEDTVKNVEGEDYVKLPDWDALNRHAVQVKAGGFFRMKNENANGSRFLLALRSGGSYRIFRPSIGRRKGNRSEADLFRMYTLAGSMNQAKADWEECYIRTKNHCFHKNCIKGPNCSIGGRITKLGILSGHVVPLWNTLESMVNNGIVAKTEDDNVKVLKILRAALDDKTRIIGVQWELGMVDQLKSHLNKKKYKSINVKVELPPNLKKIDSMLNDLGFNVEVKNGKTFVKRCGKIKMKGIQRGDELTYVDSARCSGLSRNGIVSTVQQVVDRKRRFSANQCVGFPLIFLREVAATIDLSETGSITSEKVMPVCEESLKDAYKERKSMFRQSGSTSKKRRNPKSKQQVEVSTNDDGDEDLGMDFKLAGKSLVRRSRRPRNKQAQVNAEEEAQDECKAEDGEFLLTEVSEDEDTEAYPRSESKHKRKINGDQIAPTVSAVARDQSVAVLETKDTEVEMTSSSINECVDAISRKRLRITTAKQRSDDDGAIADFKYVTVTVKREKGCDAESENCRKKRSILPGETTHCSDSNEPCKDFQKSVEKPAEGTRKKRKLEP